MISRRLTKTSALRWLPMSASAITLALVATSLIASGAACGGSTKAVAQEDAKDSGAGGKGGPTTNPVDAGHPAVDAGQPTEEASVDAKPDVDNGAPSTTYPAFKVDVAQVTNNGGPVLKAPVVVTVTWSNDPDAATYNALGDAIGPSPYWKDINSEYGVGPVTSGNPNHVSITTAPPTSYADSDLDTLVETNVGNGTWPASTDNIVYALYLPPGTTLTSQGQDLCQFGVGGYHTESQNKNYVYAIMPHCSGFASADVELSASHELNEAATDPHPGTNPGWVGFDQNHLSFEFFNQFQDELGDACESFTEATDGTDLKPYTVQRQWSNASAAAGSHWCLPGLGEPFYNTTFLPQSNVDTITVDLSSLFGGGGGASAIKTEGFKIPLNTTRVIPIGLFSDVDTKAPFTIDVQGLGQPITQDQNGNNINNGNMTATLDLASGVNGQIANLTVTPTSYSSLGINFIYIRAVLPGAKQHHYLPILFSAN